jgi:hypothetical protein
MCSSVGIITAYGLNGWGSIPGRDNMYLLHSVQTGAHPAYPMGNAGLFPGVKRDMAWSWTSEWSSYTFPHMSLWRGALSTGTALRFTYTHGKYVDTTCTDAFIQNTEREGTLHRCLSDNLHVSSIPNHPLSIDEIKYGGLHLNEPGEVHCDDMCLLGCRTNTFQKTSS